MFDYPFHIGDYLTGTAHLTDAEDLAYRRMIDLYYQKEQPLPIDETAIARRVRMPVDTVKSILDEFFTLTDDGWHNERCDRELDRYRKRVENARKAGTASAHKRSTTVQRPFNDRSTDGQRLGNQPTSLLPYFPAPQREEKEDTLVASATTVTVDKHHLDRFEKLWKEYHRPDGKGSKKKAVAEWKKLSLEDKKAAYNMLPVYLAATDKEDGRFRPHVERYLKNKLWEGVVDDDGE